MSFWKTGSLHDGGISDRRGKDGRKIPHLKAGSVLDGGRPLRLPDRSCIPPHLASRPTPEASGVGLRTGSRLGPQAGNGLAPVIQEDVVCRGYKHQRCIGAYGQPQRPRDGTLTERRRHTDGTSTAPPKAREHKKKREERAPFAKHSARLVPCQMRIAPGFSGNDACTNTLGAGTSIPGCGPIIVKFLLLWRLASSPGQAWSRQWPETG